MLAAGFQGAFRFADGDRRGAGAGEIRPLDDRVTVVRGENGTEYVQHTRAGSTPTDGVAQWTFEWRAPDADAPVVLHLAANSGGGDDSPLDDLVYTPLHHTDTPGCTEMLRVSDSVCFAGLGGLGCRSDRRVAWRADASCRGVH